MIYFSATLKHVGLTARNVCLTDYFRLREHSGPHTAGLIVFCDGVSKQIMSKISARMGLSLFSVLLSGFAWAQDTNPPGSTPSAGETPGVHMTHTPRTTAMVNMHGMHTMPATVTDVDPKTGIVDVTTDGMALRVHFPPDSMANLKSGDKIGLYMAYSQVTVVH